LYSGRFTIDNNVTIAAQVLIIDENHGTDPENKLGYLHQPLDVRNAIVGDESWIGQNATIREHE